MADDFEVMPDFLAALEAELRVRAVAAAAPEPERPRRRRRSLAALAAGLAALAILAAVLFTASVGPETAAYGKPAILREPATSVPVALKGGLDLKVAAGPDTDLTRARAIQAFGTVSYLLSGDGAWCLSVPDPGAASPTVDRVVNCARTKDFYNVGVHTVAPGCYLAVLPRGVRDPTVTHADGTTETLHPDALGVVRDAHVRPGDAFTLYAIDGTRRIIHAR